MRSKSINILDFLCLWRCLGKKFENFFRFCPGQLDLRVFGWVGVVERGEEEVESERGGLLQLGHWGQH